MNRTLDEGRLVRVPVLMDVRTYVQLAGKARKSGVSIVRRNSEIIQSHMASSEKPGQKDRT